jgi:hypothetical protein
VLQDADARALDVPHILLDLLEDILRERAGPAEKFKTRDVAPGLDGAGADGAAVGDMVNSGS